MTPRRRLSKWDIHILLERMELVGARGPIEDPARYIYRRTRIMRRLMKLFVDAPYLPWRRT